MRIIPKLMAAAAGLVLAGAAAVSSAAALPIGNPSSLAQAASSQTTEGRLIDVRFGGGGFHGGGFHGGGFHGGGFHGGGFHGGGFHGGGFHGGGFHGFHGGHFGGFHGGHGFRHFGGGRFFYGGLAAGALAYPYFYDTYPDAYIDDYDYGAYAGDGYVTDDTVAACAQRFKSYDPASGTYLGYDGKRHPCP